MGTLDINTQTIRLKPEGAARICLWTTTDEILQKEGYLYYEIETDEQKYTLGVLNSEFTESWEKKFLSAFAESPEYRARFICDKDSSNAAAYPIAPGKLTLPEIPECIQAVIIRKDIRALIRKGNKAKFKDFAQLRTGGRDSLSKLTLENLREHYGINSLVEDAFPDDKDKAKAYRWMGRGLPEEMAVRKVKTDLEVSQNAAHPKRRR